jgi:hypothetical protein
VAAFGKKITIGASGADRVSDQFLTDDVALGRINDVEPEIEGAVQQFAHGRE